MTGCAAHSDFEKKISTSILDPWERCFEERDMTVRQTTKHSLESANLADLLERILDKGIVIAGDIRIKLVDVELLTIQIRLVVCSVDKAKEIGIDWWANNPAFRAIDASNKERNDEFARMDERLARLEASLEKN